MSHAEIISGIKKMNEIPDVKEVFQVGLISADLLKPKTVNFFSVK